MFTGRDNKLCVAKTVFLVVTAVCLYKIITTAAPDYAGMAAFISPFGVVYFGRSWTKANTNE